MRFNEIINEANYKNKFDLNVKYQTEVEFKKAIAKFGATSLKDSKPQARGLVYIIDPTVGVVGCKIPNPASSSGFDWIPAITPFIPAKKQPASIEPKIVSMTPRPKTPGGMNVVLVTFDPPFGNGNYDKLISFLKSKPGMDPDVSASTTNDYTTAGIISKTLTSEQMIKILSKKSISASLSGSPVSSSPAKVSPTRATADALMSALTSIRSAMKSAMNSQSSRNSYGGSYTGDWSDIEQFDNGYEMQVRDWGGWENPDDISQEDEDDGDYDWQVLSRKWSTTMNEIITSAMRRYPTVKLNWTTEEKNYMVITAAAKG